MKEQIEKRMVFLLSFQRVYSKNSNSFLMKVKNIIFEKGKEKYDKNDLNIHFYLNNILSKIER